jgi:DNA repair exonuclease SbcCD ATPase subunit
LLTLAVALLASAILLGLQMRRPPTFAARAELLIRENALAAARAKLSREDLRSFVENVAFTSAHLQEIMDRHGLLMAENKRSPVLAQAEMRSRIVVEILQDYFAEYRLERTPLRSVRIAVTFTADTPEQAMVVAGDLGRLVARAKLGQHAERAKQEARLAEAAVNQVLDEVEQTRNQLVTVEASLAAAPVTARPAAPADRMKVVFLRASLTQLERRLSELQQQQTGFDLAAAAEEKQAATRVHLAGLDAPGIGARDDGKWFRRKASISGVAGLTLAVLLVGAFNPRLYDANDIRRAGGLAMGTLHRIPEQADRPGGDST